MKDNRESTYERIERALFKSREEGFQMLSAKEMAIKERMMLVVAKRLDNPLIEDKELVNFLIGGCGGVVDKVSQSQAYRDVAMANRLVGNIQLSAKSWYRYMIVEGAKAAYNMAMEKGDAKGAASALDKMGKYTRSDKEDDALDFSQMLPPSFEPSDDVTLLEGVERIDNLEERRRELRKLARNKVLGTPTDAEIVND